jgi:HK97 family phage portal protein
VAFWNRFTSLLPFAPKAYATPSDFQTMASWPVGQPVWSDRRYAALADQAYIRNAVAYRCVKMIAGACSALPWRLTLKGIGGAKSADVDDHALLDLLNGPTPGIPSQTLWEAFFAYLLLAGNSYLEAVGPSDIRPPMELWPYRPDRMHVIAGARSVPQAFALIINGSEQRRWKVDQLTGQSPILHLKEFHPLNDWYGLSRADPAAYGLDRHNAASAHNKALLDAGARPTGALIFKPVVINGNAQTAPPDVIAAAEARLAERHLGADKAGRPFVFGGDVTWQEMGISPRDMDFAAGKNDAARDICAGFGVPHILIVPGTQSYNNMASARLELYEDTVLPLASLAVSALNTWLTPRFGDRLTLSHNLDDLPALEPRRQSRQASVTGLWTGGMISRDEARKMLKIEAVGGTLGEEFVVPGRIGEETQPGTAPTEADPVAPPPAPGAD